MAPHRSRRANTSKFLVKANRRWVVAMHLAPARRSIVAPFSTMVPPHATSAWHGLISVRQDKSGPFGRTHPVDTAREQPTSDNPENPVDWAVREPSPRLWVM
jgi:hypothetical protein